MLKLIIILHKKALIKPYDGCGQDKRLYKL